MANVENLRKQLTQIIDNLLADFIRENKIHAKVEDVKTVYLDNSINDVTKAVGEIMDDIKPVRYEITTTKAISFRKLSEFLKKMRWYDDESHALEVIHDTFFDGEHDGDMVSIDDEFLIELAKQISRDTDHKNRERFLYESNSISYIIERLYQEGLIETSVFVDEVKGGQELK